MWGEITIRNKVTIALAVFENVNGGCEQVKMRLCHNMNDKQCENDHGNKNDSRDVMEKRGRGSRDTTDNR